MWLLNPQKVQTGWAEEGEVGGEVGEEEEGVGAGAVEEAKAGRQCRG